MTCFSYFPGCSAHGTGREYDESTRAVARVLGIEFREIADWACCGATPAHAIDPSAARVLGEWNLAAAKRAGSEPVVTGCASCFSRLRAAVAEAREHGGAGVAAKSTAAAAELRTPEILHIAQVLARPAVLEKLKAAVKQPLTGLPVACYYGCLLTRPAGADAVDNAEDPQILENLARAIGAEPVAFPLRLDCCGSSMALARPDLVHELSGKLLAMAQARGAAAVIVACPLCHSNLDFQQTAAMAAAGLSIQMPVLYLTQLVGIALGLTEKPLGLHRHFVPVTIADLLAKRKQPSADTSKKKAPQAAPKSPLVSGSRA